MTWFKVDDSFYDHPKVVDLSMAARGLWVTAGSYCGRHLTDGHITRKRVRALAGRSAAQVRELIDAGLWTVCAEHTDCLIFHDWESMQPTKESEQKRRDEAAERKRRSREKMSPSSRRVSDESSTSKRRVSDESSSGESRVSDEESKSLEADMINSRNQHESTNVTRDKDSASRVTHTSSRARRPDPTRPDLLKNSPTDDDSPEQRAQARTSSSTAFADGTPIPDAPDPEVPTAIETRSRPPKQRPTDGARTLVRQALPNAEYDRNWLDRLAIAVDKLRRAGRDPDLIREALHEWDQRSDIRTPEGLASVANDIAKRARSRPPGPGPSTTDARFAAGQALKRDDWNNPLTQPPQEAITQ